jgi:hypothetical protein
MNIEEQAIRATRLAIESKHGSIGGFTFDHLLHTAKLMYQANGAGQSTLNIEGLTLDDDAKKRLQEALATTQSQSVERTKKIIADSHKRFSQTMGMAGIEVTYGYSGDPEQTNATRTLVLGNMSEGGKTTKLDLSQWVKIGAELY